jgi:hypothetical protein
MTAIDLLHEAQEDDRPDSGPVADFTLGRATGWHPAVSFFLHDGLHHRDDQWCRKRPLAYGQKALRRLRIGFSSDRYKAGPVLS